MERDVLLRNEGYWTSKIQIDLYNHLTDYMKENNLNQSQLAKKLGVTKGYISQVLNGDFNHRISKLVELSLAIDKAPCIKFENLSEYIEKDKNGVKTISWDVHIQNQIEETANVETTSTLDGTIDFAQCM